MSGGGAARRTAARVRPTECVSFAINLVSQMGVTPQIGVDIISRHLARHDARANYHIMRSNRLHLHWKNTTLLTIV